MGFLKRLQRGLHHKEGSSTSSASLITDSSALPPPSPVTATPESETTQNAPSFVRSFSRKNSIQPSGAPAAAVPGPTKKPIPHKAIVADAPPRIDFEINRRSSPPLVDVDVDGYDSSPWVDLAHEDESSPASLGFGTSHANAAERPVNPKLRAILDEAKLSVEQVTVLVKACSRVIQEQGLETLGLFRPWRLSESPFQIAQALGVFLHASNPKGPTIPLDSDFLGLGSSAEPLLVFEGLLADLGAHNVAACLKWGLRHLRYGPGGFADALDNNHAWRFYSNFAQEEEKQVYPPFAYTSILVPSIPKSHADLLEAVLSLASTVAAHAAQNAMTGTHFCRLIAFWLFGQQQVSWTSLDDLYQDYQVASTALEHIFLAYLRSQKSLPLRLEELIQTYPPERSPAAHATDIRIIPHEAEDWPSLHAVIAMDGSSFGRKLNSKAQRSAIPGNVLATTVLANADEISAGDLYEAWTEMTGSAKVEGDAVGLSGVIAEETERIFGLIAERAARPAKKVTMSGASNGARSSANGNSNRRRSASLDVGVASPTAPLGSLSNRSVTDLPRPPKLGQEPVNRISWGEFSNKGFSENMDSDILNLINDFDRPSSVGKEAQPERPNKLKKPYPHRMPLARMYSANVDLQTDDTRPVEQGKSAARLVSLRVTQIDPVFAELYLDSLQDPLVTSTWPSFVVAELKSTGQPYRGLLVEERKTSAARPGLEKLLSSSGPPTGSAPVSPSESIQDLMGSQRKDKLCFLGRSNRKRVSDMFTRVGNSASMTNLARQSSRNSEAPVDELGRVVSREPPVAPAAVAPPAPAPEPVSNMLDNLPVLERGPPLPIIIKTSPMSPPRYHIAGPSSPEQPAPLPEETPRPNQLATVGRTKSSRVPVPVVEENDDVFVEVQKAAAASEAESSISKDDDEPTALTTRLRAEIAERAAKANHYFESQKAGMGNEEGQSEAAQMQTADRNDQEPEKLSTAVEDPEEHLPLVGESTTTKEPVDSGDDLPVPAAAGMRPVQAGSLEGVPEEDDHAEQIMQNHATEDPREGTNELPHTAVEELPLDESPLIEVAQPTPLDNHDESSLATSELTAQPTVPFPEEEAEDLKKSEPVPELEDNSPAAQVLRRVPSIRDQLDSDIQRATLARRKPSLESSRMPASPEQFAAEASNERAVLPATPERPTGLDITPAQPVPAISEDPVLSSSPTGDKQRFGGTFNRVSPSLKARLAGAFSGSKEQLPTEQKEKKVQANPKSSVLSTPAPVTPDSPGSPSKKGRFLSGAKKMLGRKKTSAPAGEESPIAASTQAPEIPAWHPSVVDEAMSESDPISVPAEAEATFRPAEPREALGESAEIPQEGRTASIDGAEPVMPAAPAGQVQSDTAVDLMSAVQHTPVDENRHRAIDTPTVSHSLPPNAADLLSDVAYSPAEVEEAEETASTPKAEAPGHSEGSRTSDIPGMYESTGGTDEMPTHSGSASHLPGSLLPLDTPYTEAGSPFAEAPETPPAETSSAPPPVPDTATDDQSLARPAPPQPTASYDWRTYQQSLPPTVVSSWATGTAKDSPSHGNVPDVTVTEHEEEPMKHSAD